VRANETAVISTEVVPHGTERCAGHGCVERIGEALARRLARDGRSLVLVARRADRLESLAEALAPSTAVEAHVLAQDLLQAGAVQAVLAEVERGPHRRVACEQRRLGRGRVDSCRWSTSSRKCGDVEALVEFTGRCLPGMVARGAAR